MIVKAAAIKRELKAVALNGNLYFPGINESHQLHTNGYIQVGRYPRLEQLLSENTQAMPYYAGDTITIKF